MRSESEIERDASPDGRATELVADFIHEINQPLAAIVNYARGCILRAQSGSLPKVVVDEAMEHIVREVGRVSELLRAMDDRCRSR